MERSILIIDDSEDDVLLTKMVLSKLDPRIRTENALSGEEAVQFLKNCRTLPSLIMLDLKMPRMDGIDILRAIRGDERLRTIPVMMVTHSDLESDRAACYNAGATCFLHKAVDLDLFAQNLKVELSRWVK